MAALEAAEARSAAEAPVVAASAQVALVQAVGQALAQAVVRLRASVEASVAVWPAVWPAEVVAPEPERAREAAERACREWAAVPAQERELAQREPEGDAAHSPAKRAALSVARAASWAAPVKAVPVCTEAAVVRRRVRRAAAVLPE